MDICNICDSELINKKLLVRSRMKKVDGKRVPDRLKYEAWCPSCEIYLRKTIQGQYQSDWETSQVTLEELQEKLSETRILQMLSEAENLPKDGHLLSPYEKWKKFISMKREDDQVYHYIQESTYSKIKGYVIKRGTFLIGSFVSEITYKNK